MKLYFKDHKIKFLFFSIIFLFNLSGKAKPAETVRVTISDSVSLAELDIHLVQSECASLCDIEHQRPFPVLHLIKEKRKKNKKIVAAILAFPLPFGIVGLHRIYLGTSPYVPVAYVATLGGVLGILPFIDFCVLILDKEIDRYQNNKKVFMWVND